VAVGAIVTALLFNIGKFLIGLYIGKTGAVSGFGAAGSVIAMVLWVYYSAQIFLFGAEFTWLYAKNFGSMKGSQSEQKAIDRSQVKNWQSIHLKRHANQNCGWSNF
jgi:membrane protein